MHAIERELIKATNYKAGRKFDNRQDYLGSLLNAVLKLTDDDFDLLTDGAATWCNAAVEAKNDKGSELPDFDDDVGEDEPDADEPEAAEDEPEEASDEPADDTAEEETDHQDQHEPDDEPKAKPAKKGAAKAKPARKAAPAKEKAEPAPKKDKPARRPKAEDDVVLDKWGCMVGSKNAIALGMFEKGATTKEVKDASEGATFYNILKKMEQAGHKLIKEGSMIRLTHKDDVGKAAKPAAKAKAKK